MKRLFQWYVDQPEWIQGTIFAVLVLIGYVLGHIGSGEP